MAIIKPNFPSIEQVTDQYLQKSSKPVEVRTSDGKSFADIYKDARKADLSDSGVRFSKHAANLQTEILNFQKVSLTALIQGRCRRQ